MTTDVRYGSKREKEYKWNRFTRYLPSEAHLNGWISHFKKLGFNSEGRKEQFRVRTFGKSFYLEVYQRWVVADPSCRLPNKDELCHKS